MTDQKHAFQDPKLSLKEIIEKGLSEIRSDLIFLKHGVKFDDNTKKYIDNMIQKTIDLDMICQNKINRVGRTLEDLDERFDRMEKTFIKINERSDKND